ncbi:MAG: C45 family peptidase [Chlamydiota bacterium]
MKVLQIAAAFLGTAALSSISFILPVVGIAAACGIGLSGAAFLFAATVSWLFLNYVTCARHSMDERVFKEAHCEGGKIYYRGKIPILELNCENPFQAGYAHGYLLGAQIHPLKKNMELAIHSVLRNPRSPQLKKVLHELRAQIPADYLREMEGLSEGYNAWAKAANLSTRMTPEDVLLVHLIPDSKHFHPKELELAFGKRKKESDLQGAMACTSLLLRDAQKRVVFGRNMDWCPFGKGADATVVILRKAEKTATLGCAGMIGAISAWNKNGLSIAMNVCPGKTSEVRGIPTTLFLREILRKSKTVRDAEEMTAQIRPLGPSHTILADRTGRGACISFYQGPREQDYIRHLEEDKPLLTVNWRYPECRGGSFDSAGRTKILNRYFREASAQIPANELDAHKLMENALKLTPLVNSWITMHSLIFTPQLDEVSMSWDNGYAAAASRETLSMNGIFN